MFSLKHLQNGCLPVNLMIVVLYIIVTLLSQQPQHSINNIIKHVNNYKNGTNSSSGSNESNRTDSYAYDVSNNSLPPKRPNILLLFPDQWRFDWSDNYFIEKLNIKTPTFQSVVQNGTRFINTLVASPLCAPSRACIASGREYDRCGVPDNTQLFPSNITTFYKLMQDNGYFMMTAGKDDLTRPGKYAANGSIWPNNRSYDLGFDDFRRSGGKISESGGGKAYGTHLKEAGEWKAYRKCWSECCDGFACSKQPDISDDNYQDNYVTQTALDLLRNKPQNTPWYLQINWPGPHDPYIITKRMNQSVRDRFVPNAVNCTLNKKQTKISRRDYLAEVENLDAQFAIIIDKVRALNEFDDTIICISSDHGDMLGDYNIYRKKLPFRGSTDVPFVCMGPQIMKNQIIDTYVTNMDLAGTFLDYSNTNTVPQMTTKSLKQFLNGTWSDDNHQYRKYVISGYRTWRLVIKQVNVSTTWKYIYCKSNCCKPNSCKHRTDSNSISLLFNIKQDPYEQHNVASSYSKVVKKMKRLLPTHFVS